MENQTQTKCLVLSKNKTKSKKSKKASWLTSDRIHFYKESYLISNYLTTNYQLNDQSVRSLFLLIDKTPILITQLYLIQGGTYLAARQRLNTLHKKGFLDKIGNKYVLTNQLEEIIDKLFTSPLK